MISGDATRQDPFQGLKIDRPRAQELRRPAGQVDNRRGRTAGRPATVQKQFEAFPQLPANFLRIHGFRAARSIGAGAGDRSSVSIDKGSRHRM